MNHQNYSATAEDPPRVGDAITTRSASTDTRHRVSAAALVLALCGLVSCTWAPPTPTSTPQPSTTATSASAELEALPVDEWAPDQPTPDDDYDRDRFGATWTDDVTVAGGRNGCDTRNDILRRDLDAIALKPGTENCVVLHGTLTDPFSGERIPFRRGRETSSDVQIDHVVSLGNAWLTGAQTLSPELRTDLANDPRNLLAVKGTLNAAKSDSDAAQWLPPDDGYRCAYVRSQIEVKTRYQLWVTPDERQAMATVLDACPATPLTK